MSIRYFIPPVLIIALGVFSLYEASTRLKAKARPGLPQSGALKVSPQTVLNELSGILHIPPPRLVLTEDMPPAWRAYYSPDDRTVYLRPSEKDPATVAHELGHHWHTLLGIRCGGAECEKYANLVEKHYVKFLEPMLISKLACRNINYP